YATQALNGMNPVPPAWVNGDFVKMPNFSWGNRIANAPPNIPFPGYLNVNATNDFSLSLTKLRGRHMMKTGVFRTHSFKAEQAMNPLTGQFLGANSTLAFGTLVANSGNPTNALFLGGRGIVEETYTFPKLRVAPRFGMAYDLSGKQAVVLRGGAGLFFDRPFG